MSDLDPVPITGVGQYITEDELISLRGDKAMLDFLDSKGDGSLWLCRESTTGRGYRLHNTRREDGHPTVRAAILTAILSETIEEEPC